MKKRMRHLAVFFSALSVIFIVGIVSGGCHHRRPPVPPTPGPHNDSKAEGSFLCLSGNFEGWRPYVLFRIPIYSTEFEHKKVVFTKVEGSGVGESFSMWGLSDSGDWIKVLDSVSYDEGTHNLGVPIKTNSFIYGFGNWEPSKL